MILPKPKLYLLCAANRIPIFYELNPAIVAEVSLIEKPLAVASLKRAFGLSETSLATALVELGTSIARMLGVVKVG